MRTQKWFRVVAVSLAVLGSVPASAQPAQPEAPAGETSAMTDKARELYIDGGKAAAKGRWAEAHAAWLAAWGLKQHYQIAGNLGAAEVELKRYREAAAHLSFYMREAPTTKVTERQKAEGLLVEARKHVGALAIKVEPAGAEVFVDGRSVGTAPLLDEVFVDAGPRMIEARLNGYEVAKATLDAALGTSRPVALTLVKSATVGSGGGPLAGAGGSDGAGGAGGSGGAGGAAGAGSEKAEEGPRKAVIITGVAASSLAIVGGIVFSVVSSANASEAKELGATLVQRANPQACSMTTPAPECAEQKDKIAARDMFGDLAVWSFIVGGVLAAGTVTYVLVAPRSKPNRTVQVTPVAAAHGGGLVISGSW